jgi:subtilisin-like proprotein convertase family protein
MKRNGVGPLGVAAAGAGAVLAAALTLRAAVVITSPNVPVAIPDDGSTTSTLVVDQSTFPGFPLPWPPIDDLDVTFSITHTWDDDVLVRIASPAVAAVTIMQNCGGSGDDFTSTTISDQGTPIANCQTSGAPVPFFGTFQAMQGGGPGTQPPTANPTALAAFDGTPANGVWTLTVADDSAICTGTLTAWSITLFGGAPLPVELQALAVE